MPVVMYLTRRAQQLPLVLLVHSHSQRVTLVFLVPVSENNQEEPRPNEKKESVFFLLGFVVLVYPVRHAAGSGRSHVDFKPCTL